MKAAPVLKTVAEFIPLGNILKKKAVKNVEQNLQKQRSPPPFGVLGFQELFSRALMNMNDI